MITALDPEKLDLVYLYGEEMLALAALAEDKFPKGTVKYFRKDAHTDEFSDLQAALAKELMPNDQLLLKGSNSMHLSDIVKGL